MKLIAFQGSPKKDGNTNRVLDILIKGIQDLNYIDCEKINLQELHIHMCSNCGFCSNATGKNYLCSHNDDMENLYSKITAAQIIVLATPIYFAGMSSQMKVFIDRLYAMTNGGRSFNAFSGKNIMVNDLRR
jgi:multimeric flavodoxin WrbA